MKRNACADISVSRKETRARGERKGAKMCCVENEIRMASGGVFLSGEKYNFRKQHREGTPAAAPEEA